MKQSFFEEEELRILGNGKDHDRGEFIVKGRVYLEDDQEECTSYNMEFLQRFEEDHKTVEFSGEANKDLTEIKGTFIDDFRKISGTFFIQKNLLLPASIKKKYINHSWKNT